MLAHEITTRSSESEPGSGRRMRLACACACFLLTSTLPARAEDWPEWRGKGRRGVWNGSRVVDNFSPQGLTVAWRTPTGSGFSGPAVARGRVFVLDFSRETGSKGTERALCLDERTGRIYVRNDEQILAASLAR
jgi:hypothetical protein